MKTYDKLKALIEQRGVHEVFGAYGQGFGIEQNADELARFLVHMQELGVESVLEIGTGWRAGLARFLHDDMGWEVVSVDIHDYGHQHGGVTFVTGLESVEGRFDLVLIDGDHSYDAVKRDHEVWGLHANKVIAFHDIAGLRDCEGVLEYWSEIAYHRTPDEEAPRGHVYERRHGFYEIVENTPARGGIGYVVLAEVAEEPPAEVAAPVEKPAPKRTPARKPAAKKPAAKK